jgi:putative redox protein
MLDYQLEKPLHGEIGTAKYQCSIEWRNGRFVSDEPVKKGGGDEGPDPSSLLIASLVTCTLVTLRMYIDHKGWDIPGIAVNGNLYQTKVQDKTITVIDRDIRYTGAVTDEQRERMNEIAQNCPISKMLEGDIRIRTYAYAAGETEKTMHYLNDDISVEWKAGLCKHSGRCVSHLGQVFNVNAHPWINLSGASTADIVRQVNECPTGALSYIPKPAPAPGAG